jgi:mRNA-degrading endonuclease RelE of RelBE toxin-antitoxin system
MSNGDDDDKVWGVHYTSRGERSLENLPESVQETVEDEIYDLGDNPYKGESKRGSLSDFRTFDPGVDRREEYRVAYVHTEKNGYRYCSVVLVGSHEGFYDKLKNIADNLDPDDIL